MWLLLTALAAIVATALWYRSAPEDIYRLGFLSLMYWGATIMWLVDHVMAYAQDGGEFFEVNADATGLGLSVVVIGLLLWLTTLLISDPRGVLGKILKN